MSAFSNTTVAAVAPSSMTIGDVLNGHSSHLMTFKEFVQNIKNTILLGVRECYNYPALWNDPVEYAFNRIIIQHEEFDSYDIDCLLEVFNVIIDTDLGISSVIESEWLDTQFHRRYDYLHACGMSAFDGMPIFEPQYDEPYLDALRKVISPQMAMDGELAPGAQETVDFIKKNYPSRALFIEPIHRHNQQDNNNNDDDNDNDNDGDVEVKKEEDEEEEVEEEKYEDFAPQNKKPHH